MKYLKRFFEVHKDIIYSKEWEKYLPPYMSIVYHDKIYKFKKGNIMLHADMSQITYESVDHGFGDPDTLEFDIYYVKDVQTGNLRLDIDITYGDEMTCEFSIESPNKVKVTQHTTYHSKFDPSNTVFALDNESLRKFVDFLNKFNGIQISISDLKFLDKYDDYHES